MKKRRPHGWNNKGRNRRLVETTTGKAEGGRKGGAFLFADGFEV